MKIAQSSRLRWGIRLLLSAVVVLLWTFTGFEDEEWALWRRYDAGTALLNIAGSAAILALAYVLTAKGTLAVRLARLTAIGASVAFTLGVLELPAILWGHDYGRTFGTRTNDTWLQLATGINQRDDELIHVHRPHSRFRGTVSGNLVWLGIPSPVPYKVDLAYDRNGFRNDQEFTQADVVVIGDSFVEGAETPRPQTVVAEIGRRLGVTAVNLGQSAYGPQQELVVLKRYGAPLAPKSVVWFLFGGNDLSDVDTYEWRRSHLDEFMAPPPLATRLFARNALTALAHLTTTPRTSPSPTARRHETTYTRGDGTTERMYLDAHEGPWEPHQWEIVARTLTSAKELSTSIGADLFVVYVPRKLRVYQGYLHAAPGAFATRWAPNNLPEVVAEFCRERDIAFLDSTLPLRRAVAAGVSVYLTDDVHWNPAGHRIVAAAVAERIQEIGTLVPPVQAGAHR